MKIYLIALFLIFGCDKKEEAEVEGPRYGLTWTGQGYLDHHGEHDFRWKLVESGSLNVAESGEFSLDGSELDLTTGSVMLPGARYRILLYADVNGNGKCDSPPLDHAWRLPISQVEEDVLVEQDHSLVFTDICDIMNTDSSDSQEEITVTGSLSLGEGVEIEGVTGLVEGAQIFAAGYPEYEAFTDAKGAFELKLPLSAGQALADQKLRILMWYSQQTGVWTIPEKRVGAAKEVSLNEDVISLDQVDLNFTAGYRIAAKNSETGEDIEKCWVRIPDLGSQTVGLWSDIKKMFEIAYLPPGSYRLAFSCPGYQDKEIDIEIDEATKFDTWLQGDPITLTPS